MVSSEMRTSASSVGDALTEGKAHEVALEYRCSTRRVRRAKAGPFLADRRLARPPALLLPRRMLWMWPRRKLHGGS